LRYIKSITFFSELISSYNQGFKVVFQPHPMDGDIADPLLTLSCLDASLPLRPIWKLFPAVILTSGTISPLNLYPKMLGF
jgi:DNA excision repair protein ERCC-2